METSQNLKKAFELHEADNLEEAEKYYKSALEENANDYRIYNLLGTLYFQKKDLDNAEVFFKKAFELHEDATYADDLARVYIAKKEFNQAIDILLQGLDINPQDDKLWFDIGLSYKNINNWERAKSSYQMAIKLNPKFNEAYFNLAYLHFNDNEPFEAVKCYEKAQELSPTYETGYFLALAYMQTKNYEEGLKNFEHRLCRTSSILSQQKTYPEAASDDRIWKGEDISGKTIYTYYEAGFGDVIMFGRYLPLLQERCKNIIFKPQRQLVSFFRENFPNIEVMDLFKERDKMNFDVHIPMLSLPLALGLKCEKMFFGHEGYMKANSDKVKSFREKYFNNDKFKIGIKWQGNTYYDWERVIKIENFFDLMEIKNTQFYSCQTYEGSEEFNKIPAKYNVVNMADAFNDFSDTAAAVENMDLVICNDTSLVHIAGALGKPCWVVLPHVYNWRWHIDLSKCDWYDSVKIFRQETQGDWNAVFKQIEKELKNYIN